MNQYNFIRYLIFSIFSLLLVGCSKEEVNLSNKIPNDAILVGKVNSETFVQEHFFHLLNEVDLFGGGNSEVMNPAEIGINPLSNYYLFVTGNDIRTLQLNVLCKLGDKDKLTAYLTRQNAKIETGDQTFAFLDMTTAVSFDEQTCLLSKTFGLPVVKEACLRMFNADYSASERVNSLHVALDSKSHFNLWTDNEEIVKLYNSVQLLLQSLGQLPTQIPMKQTSDYSLIEFAFNQGELDIDFSQYYSDDQMKQYQLLQPKVSAINFSRYSLSDSPIFWMTWAFHPEELNRLITETPQVYSLINQQLGGFITVQDILESLDGRFFMSFEGFESVVQKEYVTALDKKTGEYKAVQTDVPMNLPLLSVALGLKNKKLIEEKFGFALKNLPVENGIYNVNNEYFFKLSDSLLLVGTGQKGKQLLMSSTNNKKKIKEQIGTGPVAFQLNLADLIKAFPNEYNIGKSAEQIVGTTLKTLSAKNYIEESNVVKQGFVLTFQKDDNSLLQLAEMFTRLKTALHL